MNFPSIKMFWTPLLGVTLGLITSISEAGFPYGGYVTTPFHFMEIIKAPVVAHFTITVPYFVPIQRPKYRYVSKEEVMVQELIETMRITFGNMQGIAIRENPKVGEEVVWILQAQVTAAKRVLAKYFPQSRRFKRQADDDYDDEDISAFDQVGQIFANAGAKVKPETDKLSKSAQCDIDKEYRKGLAKCKADTCADARGILADAEAEECG